MPEPGKAFRFVKGRCESCFPRSPALPAPAISALCLALSPALPEYHHREAARQNQTRSKDPNPVGAFLDRVARPNDPWNCDSPLSSRCDFVWLFCLSPVS